MGILLWIIFGAIAGWAASVIMKTDGASGTGLDIIMGILGAVVGGFMMELFGQVGVTGFNLKSLLVAILGAVVIIFIGRLIKNR
jgi:uncharacterized membrane protein YeaQ/YmgE (transglycosylase-associated protein family)